LRPRAGRSGPLEISSPSRLSFPNTLLMLFSKRASSCSCGDL
jgi:hypothetical protein